MRLTGRASFSEAVCSSVAQQAPAPGQVSEPSPGPALLLSCPSTSKIPSLGAGAYDGKWACTGFPLLAQSTPPVPAPSRPKALVVGPASAPRGPGLCSPWALLVKQLSARWGFQGARLLST